MATRCAGVGVHQHARERSAAECHLRVLPRGMPLRGRHLHPRSELGHLSQDGSAKQREVHILASGPDHHARVDLVPQPGRALLQYQPGHRPVQQGLTGAVHRAGCLAARPLRPHTAAACAHRCGHAKYSKMRRRYVYMTSGPDTQGSRGIPTATVASAPLTGRLLAVRSRWTSVRSAVRSALATAEPVPGRRRLQVCLGLLWLLDAALQYQPFMFGPGFVTRGIEPAAAGNPAAIVSSVTWASHVMLRHIAVYNAMFASIQLLLAIGF